MICDKCAFKQERYVIRRGEYFDHVDKALYCTRKKRNIVNVKEKCKWFQITTLERFIE